MNPGPGVSRRSFADRYLNVNTRSPRGALSPEQSAQMRGTLTHRTQAEVSGRHCRLIESNSVVVYFQANHAVLAEQPKTDQRCVCVRCNIVQRFLHDAVYRLFHFQGNLRLVAEICMHLDPVPGTKRGNMLLKAGHEPFRRHGLGPSS